MLKTRLQSGETSIKRAALINMGARYGAAIVQLAYSVILARILSPEDFGVVAIAQVFVTFLALFQDMGLGSAIIQRQDLTDDDLSRLFGFSIALSLALGAAMAGVGIPVSAVYHEPMLLGICFALSLSTVFSTLNTVPTALLMKSKRFATVGLRQVFCAVAASGLGIASALLGAGPYAIVTYSVSSALLNLAWNWLSHPVKPSFREIMGSVRKVFGYSVWLFGFNLINYFSRNTDNLLIGYYFGAADLGSYSKAYQLMQYPQGYLTTVIAGVLHPMLAEKQRDVDHIYDVYLRVSKVLSLLGVFIAVFCFFSASEIVVLLYGNQWASTATCLRYLSMSIWPQMVCGASGPIFQVLNRTKEQFLRGLFVAAATVGAALTGIAMGSIESVSMLVGIAYFVPFVLLLPFLIRDSFNRNITSFLRMFAPDVAIAILLATCLTLVNSIDSWAPIASLLIKLVVGLVVYLALIIMLRQARWLSPVLPNGLMGCLGILTRTRVGASAQHKQTKAAKS